VIDAIYRALARFSRVVGLWIVSVVAFFVAAGYFLFLPRRLRHSVRAYRALFPERGFGRALLCAWRQYQDFAHVYAERLQLDRGTLLTYETEGENYLFDAQAKGQGAIVLMSHFGRWEIASRLWARERPAFTIHMGVRGTDAYDDEVADSLRKDGVNVVPVSTGPDRASQILDPFWALRRGDIVSLAGDRAPKGARAVYAPFLSGRAPVNAAPFMLALVTGAPLVPVFTYRIAKRRYRIVCKPTRYVKAAARAERDAVLAHEAARYLDQLTGMIKEHPEQWHTFGPFLTNAEAEPAESVQRASGGGLPGSDPNR
jgi:lauroyl/myristoyl acyltransferase